MENKEIVDSIKKYIDGIDAIKNIGGPKSQEFVKWVKEVKQYIEKTFGDDCQQLREFKKVDYYPKKSILFTESTAKDAYLSGLMQAKDILAALMKQAASEPADNKQAQAQTQTQPQEQIPLQIPDDSKTDKKPEIQPQLVLVKEPQQEAAKEKTEKINTPAPLKEKPAVLENKEKVLLINIADLSLNAMLYKFVKIMGYEPVVIDIEPSEDLLISELLRKEVKEDTVYAIILWKGECECNNKKVPSAKILYGTGFLTALFPEKRVLILHGSDIDAKDNAYKGFKFLAIDSIQELMELKIAREMDRAGLNIDFNLFKRNNNA
ncbi:MAG: hypothetical protein LBQ47_08005 [Endomicrobium sp.]|nr:hypothetical protein [Endomicrobium sp.]